MRILHFVLGALAICANWVVGPVAEIVRLAFSFPTSDHRVSLDLDRLRHHSGAERLSRVTSQFKSFVSRAVGHARYTGGQFTDGRSPGIA